MIVSYEEKIEELRKSKGGLTEEDQKKLKEYDDLEAEKDEVIRDKNSLEQDLIATNNRLKLKQQETTNKENEITRIKKEFSEKDKALNKKIQEAKSDLTDYKKQYGELKTKYSKQGQLLDEEQTDNNKLNKKIEQLENKIKELTK
jgi:predicted  nucleic acid-binding Zn-ribbon protein